MSNSDSVHPRVRILEHNRHAALNLSTRQYNNLRVHVWIPCCTPFLLSGKAGACSRELTSAASNLCAGSTSLGNLQSCEGLCGDRKTKIKVSVVH